MPIIQYVNNDGAGFAERVEVSEDHTVSDFFTSRFDEREPEDFVIRVNRQIVASDYTFQEGDKITITPSKIEGA